VKDVMTTEEQKQFERLQEQLSGAKQSAEEMRTYLLSILGKTNDEARMYRGLFWCLLGLGMLVLTFRFLQH
jgi:hypothetical protein